MSKVNWVKLDSTLNSSDFNRFVLPLVDKYEGKSLGGQPRWTISSDETKDKLYQTYTFPDVGKKIEFLTSIREILEISTVEY